MAMEKQPAKIGGKPPRGVKGPKIDNAGKVIKRLAAYVLKRYKIHVIIVVIGIFASVIANAQGTMFMQTLIDEHITPLLGHQNPDFTGLKNAIIRVRNGILFDTLRYSERCSADDTYGIIRFPGDSRKHIHLLKEARMGSLYHHRR